MSAAEYLVSRDEARFEGEPMPDSVTKTIVGVCEEISEKNGWTTFHVNAGSKYPVRLSTKLPVLIEQGREAGSQTASWTYKEVESDTINENTGKPYVNRYVEKVEVGGAAPDNTGVTSAPERPQAGTHEPLPIGDRERSIVRQSCLKAAAALFSGQGNVEVVGEGVRDNVAELIAAAARMEIWVYRDLDEVPF